MSFREKSVAVTLAAILLVYGGYFLKLLAFETPPPVEAINGALIGTVVSLVVLLVIAHIVVAVFDRKAEEDERDRRIELIGQRNGGYIVGGCAFIGMMLLLGQQPPVIVIHVLLGGLVLGEIVKLGSQLILYRRGV